MVTRAVRSSEDSRYCRLSGRPYGLQRGIPSPRAGVTPRSRPPLHGVFRNLHRMSITIPSRVTLSPRLTLIRLTLFRKPWVFGVDISISIVVTHAYIFFSGRSSTPHGAPSTPSAMLPYHCIQHAVQSFGCGLNARSSSTRRRSTSELLRTL